MDKPWHVINAQNKVVAKFVNEKDAATYAMPLIYAFVDYRPRQKKTKNVFPYNGGNK